MRGISHNSECLVCVCILPFYRNWRETSYWKWLMGMGSELYSQNCTMYMSQCKMYVWKHKN